MSALPECRTLNLMTGHLLVTIAVKGVIRRNHSLFQSCRYRKDLRWRTRLVGITDIVISPLLVPGHLKSVGADLICGIMFRHLVDGDGAAVCFFMLAVVGLHSLL